MDLGKLSEDGIEVTKMMIPSYMLPYFRKAIKTTGKSIDYLVEHDYCFYVCEAIFLEITHDDSYRSSHKIMFEGIRIRMSTTRKMWECSLSGMDQARTIKFSPIWTPPPEPKQPNRVSLTIDQIMARREADDPMFRLFEWLFQKVLRLIDRLNGETKSKNEDNPKNSTEQMDTLGELFEGDEDDDCILGSYSDEMEMFGCALQKVDNNARLNQSIKDYARERSHVMADHNQRIADLEKEHMRERTRIRKDSNDD